LYAKTKQTQNQIPFWSSVFSKTLSQNDSAFRLPAGFKVENFKVGASGTLSLVRIKLAQTMSQLGEL
jgi:hypothetical protein